MSKKKKDKDIELSPKYGVNPSLETCFWCREAMGVAMLGRIRKDGDNDVEAPKSICLGLNPCDECKKKFAQGVHLIEVSDDASRFGGENPRFAMHTAEGAVYWPTGRYAILKPEALKDGKAGGRMLCSKEVMDHILGTGGEEESK